MTDPRRQALKAGAYKQAQAARTFRPPRGIGMVKKKGRYYLPWWDKGTVKAYQRRHGLTVTGDLDKATLRVMKKRGTKLSQGPPPWKYQGPGGRV